MSSSSEPSNGAFRVASVLVVGGLSVSILVLALLVTASGPRVRHAVVQNRSETGAGGVASVDQGLTLVFDRPVDGADFERDIHVRPSADFERGMNVSPNVAHTVSHRDRQLSITFDENLLSGAAYTLMLEPTLEDDSGKRMQDEYRYEFTTAEPAFTYLERNYGPQQKDRIVERWPLSGESQTLLEADAIEHFARGGDNLAVVMGRGNDAADELRVLDLQNGEDTRVEVPGNVKIGPLEFSPLGGQFALVTRANVGLGADEAFQKGYDGRLYRYDVAEGELQPVDTLSESGNVESVTYSNDGGALLYRTLEGAYFLTGAAGTAEPVQLGSYAGSGGFDRSNTRILFRTDEGEAEIYDARTKRLRGLPHVNASGSTPTFLHNSDELVYTEGVLDPSTGQTILQVSISNEAGQVKPQVKAQPPSYFYDDPVVSYDDRHILVEGASASGEFDSYAANSQPKDARLKLFDRFDRKVIDEVRGIDPVWNR